MPLFHVGVVLRREVFCRLDKILLTSAAQQFHRVLERQVLHFVSSATNLSLLLRSGIRIGQSACVHVAYLPRGVTANDVRIVSCAE